MELGAHIIVKGVVQGVGFRYFVYQHAFKLGLAGQVNNLPTGEVEIFVEGERSLIEELIKVVKTGPRTANVTDVQINWKELQHQYNRFEIS